MLTIATLLLVAGPPAAAAIAAVPPEIEQHYREYNFVNAFSTAGERHTIASGVMPSERRLARVARLMNRLEQRVAEIDPGMARRSGRSHETAFRSDLMRVASCRVDAEAGEAWVTLDVTALDRGSNVTLVGKFDGLAARGRTPSLNALLSATPPLPQPTSLSGAAVRIHTTEIHHWIRVDGAWRREAATLHFLAN